MKSRFPRRGWLILVVILGVFAVAYLSGFVFHDGVNIRLVDLHLPDPTNPLFNPLEHSICTNRFCSVSCPAEYIALTGRCSSSGGSQWNLNGVSSNFKSWNCFDSSLLNAANIPSTANPPITVAEAMCVKVGNSFTGKPPTLGNYVIEGTEVCDLNNTGTHDCSEFTVKKWDEETASIIDVPLCNGYLSCNPLGTNYDVSHCQYCNDNGIANGIEVGNNGQCGAGECFCSIPFGSSSCVVSDKDPECGDSLHIISAGEECEPPNTAFNIPGLGDFFCDGSCRWLPMPPNPPGPVCGDSILQGSEECDPPGTTSLTGSSAFCNPPGYCVYETATCQPNCTWRTAWPACGGGSGVPADGTPIAGGGSCYYSGVQSLPSDV